MLGEEDLSSKGHQFMWVLYLPCSEDKAKMDKASVKLQCVPSALNDF